MEMMNDSVYQIEHVSQLFVGILNLHLYLIWKDSHVVMLNEEENDKYHCQLLRH